METYINCSALFSDYHARLRIGLGVGLRQWN